MNDPLAKVKGWFTGGGLLWPVLRLAALLAFNLVYQPAFFRIVIQDGHLIIVQDIDKDPTFLGRAVARAQLPRGAVSFLALPIRVDHRTVGAIACHRIRHRERALSDDLTILRIIATMVSQLLTLNERVEQKTRALEEHNDMLARELRIKRARYGIIGTSPAPPAGRMKKRPTRFRP